MKLQAQVSGEPIVRVAVSSSAAASTAIIPAKQGHKIRLLAAYLSSAGTTDVTIEGGNGDNKIGLVGAIAQYGFVLPFNEYGWCETNYADSLNLLLSQAVQVGGVFVYQHIPYTGFMPGN